MILKVGSDENSETKSNQYEKVNWTHYCDRDFIKRL